jgi:hypothetical protein
MNYQADAALSRSETGNSNTLTYSTGRSVQCNIVSSSAPLNMTESVQVPMSNLPSQSNIQLQCDKVSSTMPCTSAEAVKMMLRLVGDE